jgi:hypothetical protein
MASRDVVAEAIAKPMDWGRFEELAYALLVADDLPRLRKIGGGSDEGIDSQEESFFDAQRKIATVVQVTSQRTQKTRCTTLSRSYERTRSLSIILSL